MIGPAITGPAWHLAALIARAAGPGLPAAARIRFLGERLTHAAGPSGPWPRHLLRLLSRDQPWPSAEEEILASHPATARLDELARDADPAELAGLSAAVTLQIAEAHRLFPRWPGGVPDAFAGYGLLYWRLHGTAEFARVMGHGSPPPTRPAGPGAPQP